MKCSKKAHTCCPCHHRCQNVNDERNVACPSIFTACFGPPTYRVPERFKASTVWLCERHAKAVFQVQMAKKRGMLVKHRNTGKQRAPAKRARATPREAEASVAFYSAGADDSDESDEGDGAESDHSGDDAAREALDGEHVMEWDEVDDSDDLSAFEHTMKKASKNVKKKKKLMKKFAGDASGMTGVSEGCWGIVAC